MKPLKGNPTLRLLRLVLRRFNRLELLIQNNSRPLPDDLIDTPAVRMLTRMSDRTLSRRRSDGTIPYVKHDGKIYYSRSRVLEALRNGVFQDDGEKADLETARIAVERELREKKYDADRKSTRLNSSHT